MQSMWRYALGTHDRHIPIDSSSLIPTQHPPNYTPALTPFVALALTNALLSSHRAILVVKEPLVRVGLGVSLCTGLGIISLQITE